MFPHSASLSVRSFQTRAALYGRLDTHLRQKTRFFGAAAMTNRVLTCLASVRAGLLCSQATCAWLCSIGGGLEARNIRLAEQISRRQFADPRLDQELVSLEQTIVEDALAVARGIDANQCPLEPSVLGSADLSEIECQKVCPDPGNGAPRIGVAH
jgi:hypothetical protein